MISEKGRENKVLLWSGLGIGCAVAVSLFAHWEPSGESWYYWFFARLVSETGTFCIPDRSPLYTLYLQLFRWMGYPLSVTVEYCVTTFVAVFLLFLLFRSYFRPAFLVLVCILWIPLLQVSEPPVQAMAMACLCFAAVIRSMGISRAYQSLSYALLIAGMMFRPTYVVALIVFLCWDIGKIFRGRTAPVVLLPRRQDWPILVALLFALLFQVRQSTHPWSGTSPASAQWMPVNGKSLKDASFIQYANRAYILKKYGNFRERDWYFTNRELFGGASTMVDAIKKNPKFVIGRVLHNAKDLIIILSRETLLPGFVYSKFQQGSKWWYLIHLLMTLPVVGIILYGAFRGAVTEVMCCFLISSILILITTVLAIPGGRYLFPVSGIIILSLSFYLKKLGSNGALRFGLAILLVLVSSAGTRDWAVRLYQLAGDVIHHQVKVLELKENVSMKASKAQWAPLIQNCSGIMTTDALFIAGFFPVPVNKIYNLFEIPPFGSLGHSSYDGLRPERIDCVLINNGLPVDPGSETNERMRYDHYIKPYVQRLEALGAVTYKVPLYGDVTVLRRKLKQEGKDINDGLRE